jgi:DNA replication licensing factor MCM4
MKRFLEFLHTFREPRSNELLYSRLLSEMIETEQYNVNIDMQFLRHFDAALFDRCVRYPQELIPLFDLCVAEFIETQYPEVRLRRRCQVRLCNMPSTKSMRELDPRDIDQLITLNGMVIRCAPIAPDMRAAFYECINCKHTTVVEVDRGRIQEPSKCTQCNTNFGMQLIHNRSKFVDRQCIRVQEAPENMPDGDTPHTLDVYCFDSLVDVAKPGDRVEITGVYRGVPVRVNNRRRTVKAVFKTYIDALHVKKTRAGQISAEDAKMGTENEYHSTFDESSVDQSVSEAMTRRVMVCPLSFLIC